MITKIDAIQSLRPNSQFVIHDGVLEWHDTEQTQPTEEEIQTEIKRLEQQYNLNQYSRDRAAAYPSQPEQMDLLFHKGITGWRDEILKIKNEHQKPGAAKTHIGLDSVIMSALSDGSTPTYEVGTVLEAIDEFIDNNTIKCRVCETNASKVVLGVFSHAIDGKVYIANRGNFPVRIRSDQTLTIGCLLSAVTTGDAIKQEGTAIQSTTIGRVLSTTKLETYSDGSYTVLCNLTCG